MDGKIVKGKFRRKIVEKKLPSLIENVRNHVKSIEELSKREKIRKNTIKEWRK